MLVEDEDDLYEADYSDMDLYEYVFSGTDFTLTQKDIIDMWLARKNTDKNIQETVSKKHGITVRQVETEMTELRQYVVFKLAEYNKE